MKEYSVFYTSDLGKLRLHDTFFNKKKAIKEAKTLIEKEVFINVYEVKKVGRINL